MELGEGIIKIEFDLKMKKCNDYCGEPGLAANKLDSPSGVGGAEVIRFGVLRSESPRRIGVFFCIAMTLASSSAFFFISSVVVLANRSSLASNLACAATLLWFATTTDMFRK